MLGLSKSFLLTTFLAVSQVTALQNGNSFNTMLRQNNQVQTISINRTMNHLSVQGAFSNANVTNAGTQACGVSHPAEPFIIYACMHTLSRSVNAMNFCSLFKVTAHACLRQEGPCLTQAHGLLLQSI